MVRPKSESYVFSEGHQTDAPKVKDSSEVEDVSVNPINFESISENITPIQLSFKNLSFYVEVKDKSAKKKNGSSVSQMELKTPEDIVPHPKKGFQWKRILHNITGHVNSGELLAIMGSSGAGKTTLLNVLSGRASGRIEGDILVNGHPRNEVKSLVRKNSCYIMQDDIMLKTLTPREILTFSALLRIRDDISKEEKLARVEKIIQVLNLEACANTRVGAPGVIRGISGGERKRVAIGTELVTNPSLLFVDEPTSGLDSFTAETVMHSLRQLALGGRTVVCTIHQPNSEIFQAFDKLLLLAKGRIIYFGPANQSVHYFGSIGHPCDKNVNPPDHFIKLMHVEYSVPETEERVDQLIEDYQKSDIKKKEDKFEPTVEEVNTEKLPHKGFAQGRGTQISLLLKRNFMDLFREPMKMRTTFMQTLFLSIIFGLIYLQMDNDQPSIQDRLGALFFLIINQAFGSVLALVNVFPEEKQVVFREIANNMYRPSAYYVAKVVGDLPYQLFLAFLFTSITYWMIGLQSEAENFFRFLVIIILLSYIGASLGFLIGTLAPDATVAVAVVPVVILPFMIFSGFFVNSNTFDDNPQIIWLIWVEYISFMKYAFEATVLIEFDGLNFTCNDDEKILVSCPDNPEQQCRVCRVENGDQVIRSLGFEDSSIFVDTIVLLAMFAFWRVISYLAFRWKVSKFKANS